MHLLVITEWRVKFLQLVFTVQVVCFPDFLVRLQLLHISVTELVELDLLLELLLVLFDWILRVKV